MLELRLEYGDTFGIVSIGADGAFQFADTVPDGATFNVTVANGRRCGVGNAQGVVAGASVDDIAVRCTAPVDVLLSAPVPFTFDPVESRSAVDVSILTQLVHLTVIAPGMTIEIDGTAAISEMPVTITVAPGEHVIQIELTDGPRHRRYELVLRRGARPVEYAGHHRAGVMQVNPAELGASLALSEDELIAGAPWYDAGLPDEGAVRRFVRDGATWSASGSWVGASVASAYAEFGNSVAIDGDLLAIGAHHEIDDFLEQGAVYVFRRTVTGWTQVARLVAPHPGFGDYFGGSVAIDGDTIVIGALGEDSGALGVDGNPMDESAGQSGAVYVFEQTATDVWTPTAYLKASTVVQGFGISVAIDGERIAVGAGLSRLAYVFRRSGASWVQEARIEPPLPGQTSLFGIRVAVSGDRVAVADNNDSGVGPGINGSTSPLGPTGGGAVFVFRSTGSGWEREAYIKASRPTDNASFGIALAFVGDVIAVGANGHASASPGIDGDEGNTSAFRSGAVYLFHRAGTTWSQDAYIKSTIPVQLAELGRGVALSMTGLAMGAPREPGGGAVYLIR